MHIFRQHINLGDSHMIESQVTIIFGIVSKFGSNVTNKNSREWLMSLGASDGDDEDLNSVFFAINKELSLGYNMCGCDSHVWSPPFGGTKMGCVNYEFPSGFIIGGSGLKTVDVRAMG